MGWFSPETCDYWLKCTIRGCIFAIIFEFNPGVTLTELKDLLIESGAALAMLVARRIMIAKAINAFDFL